MIPESFIEELRYRCDMEQIVSSYTHLKRAGRTLKGLCPFHSEKTPSFVVYPENNSFYCFGCAAGGDIITFIKMAEHLEYVEAVRFLAEKVGMTVPDDVREDSAAKLRTRLLELNRESARFFYSNLISPQGTAGLQYLRERGLSDRTIRRFGLGYAPDSWDKLKNHLLQKGFSEQEMLAAAVIRQNDRGGSYDQFRNRVMFPIIDLRGAVIGFGGRNLGDQKPKYLNSSDTPVFKKSRGLFAMNIAKATKEQRLILCEGYMDAIAIHQAGFDNAVATLGTALTSEQARLISQYVPEVVLSYDSDEAGRKATDRAERLLSEVGLRIKVLNIPNAKDPDEFIKRFGAQRFKQLVEGSANSTEYAIELLKKRFPPDTDDGKVNFINEFCNIMAKLENHIEAEIYTRRIESEMGLTQGLILEKVDKLREKKQRVQQKKFNEDLKIFAQEQPNARKDIQRAANMRYALAEDKLIAVLMKNPDCAEKIAMSIAPSQFVTDFNRELFAVLIERIVNGESIDMMMLSSRLSTEQMSWLSHILATTRDYSYNMDDAKQFIDIILSKQNERTDEQVGSMEKDELQSFIAGIAAKKNRRI